MPVCGIVKIATPRCREQLDALFTISRGRKVHRAFHDTEGSSFVYSAKQPWNNCLITQPMLKISKKCLLNWHATSVHATYLVTLDVILMMFDVINQAIDKTSARCFSIPIKWVTSQTWYSRFYGPAGDVI